MAAFQGSSPGIRESRPLLPVAAKCCNFSLNQAPQRTKIRAYRRNYLKPKIHLALALTFALLASSKIQAQGLSERSSRAPDCFDAAALHHGVNPWLLRAIAKHESSGKASARGINDPSNGLSISRSEDWGMMQINTQHLPKLAAYGVRPEQLWDGCTSVFFGAWILRGSVSIHGNTWTAVGAYNSPLPARRAWYAGKIQAILANWQKRGYMPAAT